MSILSTGVSDWEFAPLVVKPKAACRMLACGNTRLYELIAARDLESFVDGRSRKITTESIRAYIARRVHPAHDIEPPRLAHNPVERAPAKNPADRKRRIRGRSQQPVQSLQRGGTRKPKLR